MSIIHRSAVAQVVGASAIVILLIAMTAGGALGSTRPTSSAAKTRSIPGVFVIPSAKSCVRGHSLTIRLRKLRHVTWLDASVRVDRKIVKIVKRSSIERPMSIKDLPRGAFVVSVGAKATSGRTASIARTYRACESKVESVFPTRPIGTPPPATLVSVEGGGLLAETSPPVRHPLTSGVPVEGVVSAAGSVAYTFTAVAGRRVSLAITNPRVEPSGGLLQMQVYGSNGARDVNAMTFDTSPTEVDFTPNAEQAGATTVVISPYSFGATGTFTLTYTTAGPLRIGGNAAMVSLVEDLAAAYRNAGFETEFQISKLADSNAGIDAAAEGEDEIGLAAESPTPSDPPGLLFTRIAREEVCVVTNDANSIGNLDEETIDGIFTGRIRDWSEVPGASIAGAIDPLDYEPSTPTQEAFQRIFLGELMTISGATAEPSEELMHSAVAANTNAVGFVRDGKVTGMNSVDYEGTPCTVEAARSGEYPATRSFWLVTKGPPSGESLAFMDWIEESSEAANVIESNWLTVR